uniref:C-Maf-inducing protein n=1 Tax=Plectus sambesii TaxID=2011161 RepID=A0A914W6B5_9BILA
MAASSMAPEGASGRLYRRRGTKSSTGSDPENISLTSSYDDKAVLTSASSGDASSSASQGGSVEALPSDDHRPDSSLSSGAGRFVQSPKSPSHSASAVNSPSSAMRALNTLLRSPLRTPQRRNKKGAMPPPLSLDVMSISNGRTTPPDQNDGQTDTLVKEERRFKLKFRLPPVIRKKRSCPSLYHYNNTQSCTVGNNNNNNNIGDEPASPKTPMLSGDTVEWIRNPLSGVQAPASANLADYDCGPVFRFDFESTDLETATGGASRSRSFPTFVAANAGVPAGARYMLVKDSPPVQICRLVHPRTVVGKLSSSKLLRRWETHCLVLNSETLASTTTNQLYARNQWLYSLQWRRYMLRYRRLLRNCSRPEVLLKEIMSMVEMAQGSPLQDDSIFLEPVRLVCRVLQQIFEGTLPHTLLDPVITCIAPLLETVSAVAEICPWFNRYCRDSPRSRLVDDIFSNVAHHTLKRNMDFGKFPSARTFVQNFLVALMAQNDGLARVRMFIDRVHGPTSQCPHPRVLPNLISAALAAIQSVFDPALARSRGDDSTLPSYVDYLSSADLSLIGDADDSPCDSPARRVDRKRLECYCVVLDAISEFDDWRATVASMIQPLPFPESALSDETFAEYMSHVVRRIGGDARCEVHRTVLGVREGKEGWFHIYCPGGLTCVDDGQLYAHMLRTLLSCCCKRKHFLQGLTAMLGPLQLLALRENDAAMQALCFMLELEVVEGEDLKMQMITSLQSTSPGRRYYAGLCDRQIALRELQQKGGPRKLTLPSKSTDGDLAVLLSSGSFGNLEWLSLAFTNVTSACAELLIKLPSLRYLNLWSTQFGDAGVQLISEHLTKLQVLNLCETRVTDRGLESLAGLKNLRKLNLNSTRLSATTFQQIKAKLPALQEVDVRYTEAWCAEDYTAPPRPAPPSNSEQ